MAKAQAPWSAYIRSLPTSIPPEELPAMCAKKGWKITLTQARNVRYHMKGLASRAPSNGHAEPPQDRDAAAEVTAIVVPRRGRRGKDELSTTTTTPQGRFMRSVVELGIHQAQEMLDELKGRFGVS